MRLGAIALAKSTLRFKRDESGSIATSFALMSVAICAIVGLAVDVGRISKVKETLQASLDQAVLAVANGKQSEDPDAVARLTAYMSANWKERHGATSPILSYSEPGGSTILATAKTTVPTTFSNILGIGAVDVGAVAQSSFGMSRAEVALVLDTTKSMEGSKIDALKDAAEELIDATYEKPEADAKIKFSIVPFAQYVNVGLGSRGRPWISVPNDGPVTSCKMEKPILSKSGCTMKTGTWWYDGSPVTYTYEECSSIDYGPEVEVCSTRDATWSGCVGSRASPLDSQVELSSANPVPGIMDIWCANELKRLTNNKSDLRNAVRDLTSSGFTYMAPGLMWGWRTLSPTKPFEDGAPKTGTNRARKVMVLMTDGANTTSSTAPTHEGWDTGAGNATTSTVCQNVKNDGIEIYAIAFEVTDPTALAMLQDCASSPVTHYFNATDATKLADAFRKIGESLTTVRLSK